jgi:hypothetical protein
MEGERSHHRWLERRFLRSSPAHLLVHLEWPRGRDHVQVLSFHDWTFFFAITCFLGRYSMHRMAMIEEGSEQADRLLLRDFLLEARRSMHSLSTAAGLLRIARTPFLFPPTAAGYSAERPEKPY